MFVIECELNNFGRFFACWFKLPLADRIRGLSMQAQTTPFRIRAEPHRLAACWCEVQRLNEVPTITFTSMVGSHGGAGDQATHFLLPQGRVEIALWVVLSITAGICETDRNVISVRISERELLGLSVRLRRLARVTR